MSGLNLFERERPEETLNNIPAFRDRVKKKVEAAVAKFNKENLRDDQIEEYVHNVLDQHLGTIIASQIGMINRWHEWEIDRVNGRKSALSNEIEQAVRDAANEWLEKALTKPITPNAKQLTAIRKEYQREFEREVEAQVKHIAQQDAVEWLEQSVKKAG